MKHKMKGASTAQGALLVGLLSAGGTAYYSSVPTSAEITAQNLKVASEMYQQIEDAALNDYVANGAWSANLDTLVSNKKYFGTKISPYGTVFTAVPTSDGGFLISSTVKNAAQANQLKNLIGNGSVSGLTVSKKVGTPAEGALRNSLLSDYVDITSTSQLKFQTDINMNGNEVKGVSQLQTGQVTLTGGGVVFPTTAIKESAPNTLSITATNTSTSGNIDVAGTAKAKDLDVTNSIKASLATLTDGNFTNTTTSNLTATTSKITTADVQTLVANVANFKAATAQTLTVAGLTTLADVVANNATFNGLLTTKDLTISGKGIVNLLEADGIQVSNANITRAEVTNLLGNVASFSQLTSAIVNATDAKIGTGVITNLTSTNATLNNLVSDLVTAKTINVDNLKAVNSELESATAKTLNVLGVATFKTLNSDNATLKTVTATTVNAQTYNTTNMTVNGKTTTKSFQADSGTVGALTVANQLTTKSLNVTNDANVAGTLTSNQAKVTNDLSVGDRVTTKNLTATGTATLNKATATNVTTSALVASGNVTAGSLSVTNGMVVGGALNANTVAAQSANVTGQLTANSVTATTATLTTANTTNANVTGTTSTRDLVVTATATLTNANISNLVASISSIGNASGTSMTLTGNLTAAGGTFNTFNTSGLAKFGSLEVIGNANLKGPLSVLGDISARNLNLSGTLTAATGTLTSLNSNSISATGNVTGADIKTNSGVSLNTLKTGFDSHESRVTNMETWIAQCKAKTVAECNR